MLSLSKLPEEKDSSSPRLNSCRNSEKVIFYFLYFFKNHFKAHEQLLEPPKKSTQVQHWTLLARKNAQLSSSRWTKTWLPKNKTIFGGILLFKPRSCTAKKESCGTIWLRRNANSKYTLRVDQCLPAKGRTTNLSKIIFVVFLWRSKKEINCA